MLPGCRIKDAHGAEAADHPQRTGYRARSIDLGIPRTREALWTSRFTTPQSPVRSRPTSPSPRLARSSRSGHSISGGQHTSPEYLKINPKHKVPLLIVDGKVLSESVAIQTWIARTFPQAKLLPADPWQELQAISLMSWCSGGIHPFLARINSPPRVCDVPGAEESVKKARGREPDGVVQDRR